MSEVLGGQLGGIAVIQESDLNGLPPKHQDVGDAATQEVSVPLELLELLREECVLCIRPELMDRDFRLARLSPQRSPGEAWVTRRRPSHLISTAADTS